VSLYLHLRGGKEIDGKQLRKRRFVEEKRNLRLPVTRVRFLLMDEKKGEGPESKKVCAKKKEKREEG